jgi:predicted RND superfamily exporter protein
MIPLGVIGIIGYFHIPFDIISSPGANIAIGIGVDSMINMLFFVKRHLKVSRDSKKVWSEACSRLWRPILYSTAVTCLGFGIFILSAFPPTQRFGFSVILGTLIAPLAALFVFPWIATHDTNSNNPTH